MLDEPKINGGYRSEWASVPGPVAREVARNTRRGFNQAEMKILKNKLEAQRQQDIRDRALGLI